MDTARVASLAATAFRRVARYFGVVPFAHYTILQELLTPLSLRHDYNFSMEHLDSMTSTLSTSRALTAASPAADDQRFQFNLAHQCARTSLWSGPSECRGQTGFGRSGRHTGHGRGAAFQFITTVIGAEFSSSALRLTRTRWPSRVTRY